MRRSDSKRTRIRKKLWIGLACVKQNERGGVLGDARGAYVNAIALAASVSDFGSQIQKALSDLHLQLVSLEDVETLIERLSKHTIDEDLRVAAAEVSHTCLPAFGKFYAFADDGSPNGSP